MNTATILQKLWNYCNALHDDGMSYGDHVEQLTYLLFLKMADDRIRVPYVQPAEPGAAGCDILCWRDGVRLSHRNYYDTCALMTFVQATQGKSVAWS